MGWDNPNIVDGVELCFNNDDGLYFQHEGNEDAWIWAKHPMELEDWE